jgi:RHS repeat-associated protein
MQMAGSYMPANANKKLYNAGSEWQDDVEGMADYYSTFFREYDPVIGRFNGVDPVSESFESWSTYHYSYNNPVNFNDPMGNTAAPTGGYRPERGMDYWMAQQDQITWGGWEEVGGGGGGNSRFNNARELLEYIRAMGTTSINTSFGGLYANAWGVYDMSISEVSNAWSELGSLDVNKKGQLGNWVTVDNYGDGGYGNKEGAYKGVMVQKSWVSFNGLSPENICEKSFKFTRIFKADEDGGGWQVAGVSGIRMQIVDTRTGEYVPIILPTIYFGLPAIRKNGDFYSVDYAAKLSAVAVTKAEQKVMDLYHLNPAVGLNIAGMSLYFRESISTEMLKFAGTATLIPGFNMVVTPHPAYYGTWGICW